MQDEGCDIDLAGIWTASSIANEHFVKDSEMVCGFCKVSAFVGDIIFSLGYNMHKPPSLKKCQVICESRKNFVWFTIFDFRY